MLKQSSSRMKKVLASLLAVLFIVSLTAVAASARDERHDGDSDRGGHDGHRDVGPSETSRWWSW